MVTQQPSKLECDAKVGNVYGVLASGNLWRQVDVHHVALDRAETLSSRHHQLTGVELVRHMGRGEQEKLAIQLNQYAGPNLLEFFWQVRTVKDRDQ